MEEKKENTSKGKKLNGIVVSDKMAKTVVVLVRRYVKHGKYGKYSSIEKRYKAHDENGQFKKGDRVVIGECRPLSKEKRFKVLRKI